jgi:hypothetical protein
MTDELRLTLNLPKPEYFDSFDNRRACLQFEVQASWRASISVKLPVHRLNTREPSRPWRGTADNQCIALRVRLAFGDLKLGTEPCMPTIRKFEEEESLTGSRSLDRPSNLHVTKPGVQRT